MAARAAKLPEERDLTPFAPRRVIGQERAWAQLANLYGTGSGPAGLILYGPAGVGKRTAAMVLAKMLLSGDAPRAGADAAELNADHERAARMVESGAHPDVLLLEKLADKSELTVGVIRKIGRFFSTTGSFSQRRIVIIDGAEQMNREAANALLKRLEEPPQGGLVILISRSLGSLLPTVLSRCAKVPFVPLGDADFAAWADSTGQAELGSLGEAAGFAPGSALGLSDGKVLGWLEQLEGLGREYHPQRHAAKAARLASAIGKTGDHSFRAPFLRAVRQAQDGLDPLQARRGQRLYQQALGAFARIDGLNVNAEDEWRALLVAYASPA
jgi:DNA polymerase-3 subunit delta'